jgi:hypothetical protein
MTRKTSKKRGNDNNEELESYLTNKTNLEIYDDLTEGEWAGMFEPLVFFKLLYAQFEFVKNNKLKPLFVVASLNKLTLNDTQKNLLFYYLEDVIANENGRNDKSKDKQLEICRNFMHKECNRIAEKVGYNDEEIEISTLPAKFDFAKVKQHLETLPDEKAQIKYLIEIKAEYDQQNHSMAKWGRDFSDLCDIEIKKIRDVHLLNSPNEKQVETKPNKRNADFTTARQVLAIRYMLTALNATLDVKAAEIRFAEFITGKNLDAVKEAITELKERDNAPDKRSSKVKARTPKTQKQDLNFIRAYFKELKIDVILKYIDEDIKDIDEGI